ncbi:hypothetical protein DMENIID0001_170350 [Sergentomyia squamirostris]
MNSASTQIAVPPTTQTASPTSPTGPKDFLEEPLPRQNSLGNRHRLYGTTSKTNISVLQCFQSKVLRQLCGAPWYVRNEVIHRDLQINTVSEEIRKASLRYKDRIKEHPNKLATRLLDKPSYRRLKRTDPRGLSVE